jgi:hypothetical protein
MKKNTKEHQNLVVAKLGEIKEIPPAHQNLVLSRLEKIKGNPERLLDWDEVSNELADDNPKKSFDARNFNGTLKVNEDAMVIQKRLRDEWN